MQHFCHIDRFLKSKLLADVKPFSVSKCLVDAKPFYVRKSFASIKILTDRSVYE